MKHNHLAVIIVIVVIAGSAFFSCQTRRSDANRTMDKKIDFIDVDEAANFDVPISGTTVIKNKRKWYRWWKQYWNLYSGSGEKTPPPEFDFDEQMIIAIHWGEGFSGCSNKVQIIDGIYRSADSINVVVMAVPNLGPCDMEVYPIQMVSIPHLGLPVKFSGAIPEEK